jgi:hypothetical protein
MWESVASQSAAGAFKRWCAELIHDQDHNGRLRGGGCLRGRDQQQERKK